MSCKRSPLEGKGVCRSSDFSKAPTIKLKQTKATVALGMNSKIQDLRLLLVFALFAFCQPAPKLMLLETADGEDDAKGKADDNKSKDEIDFQVEQSSQICTISHVWTTETSF